MATTAGLFAAPPDVPVTLKAKPGQLVRVTVKAGDTLGYTRTFTDSEAFWGELVGPKGERAFVFQAPVDGSRKEYVVSWWNSPDKDGVSTTIVIEGFIPPVPPLPPDPTPPGPNPPDPKPPQPVTSFRVIMVFESGDTLTPQQNSVLYGKEVEAYLIAKTTKEGTQAGFRRRDQNALTTGDTATFNGLWGAVKTDLVKNNTKPPVVAIEVNGKVDILPFPATVAEALTLFQKYRGDK